MTLWSQPNPTASIAPPAHTQYSTNQFDASQFADPANRAYSILSSFCGPQLALTFSKFLGKNLTPDAALQIAQQYGYRVGQGMSGPQAEKNLLDAVGVPSEYRVGVDWDYLGKQIGQGAIAGVSTPGHYFSLEGYDPASGQFDTGASGQAYRAGNRFLTAQQIINLGGPAQAQFVVRQNQAGPANVPQDYGNPWANRAAAIAVENNLDPRIFVKLVKQESNFNPGATSQVGAGGLTQLMPETAKGLGVDNVYDPEQNLTGGAKFLSGLLKQFNGDYRLALAAYNAGPGNVQKYGGVPPFEETQRYLASILGDDTPTATPNTPTMPQLNQAYTQVQPTGGLYGHGSLFSQPNQIRPPAPSGGLFNTGAFMSLFQNVGP